MIRSLQQRLVLFLLLPVSLLLFSVGLGGFLYARNAMLNEWRKTSILKLQRAAHYIDMRLETPLQWIKMFHNTGGMREGYAVQDWLLQQLRNSEGVARVDLKWIKSASEAKPKKRMPNMEMGAGRRGMMRFRRATISEVTPPRHDAQLGQKTVSLTSQFKDENGRLIGALEVAIRFDYLLEDIQALGWWQSELAGLIDDSGRYIAHTQSSIKDHNRLGETGDLLELDLLAVLQKKRFGTLLGSGHPPDRVSGFHKLKNAPWAILLFAPGEKILAPIIRFRTFYALAGGACIIIILLLIRFMGSKMVRSIEIISKAADRVAHGKYGDPLPVKTKDEIGQLVHSFNKMVRGLEERDFIRNTFGRYVDQEIAGVLLNRPGATRLGGEKRQVAILMSDLRGFTPLSESLSPEATISMLNRYFSHMIRVVGNYKGIIVDFFGDALLVFFDPLNEPVEPTIQLSIDCAVEMQREIEIFNAQSRAEKLPELQMGIGVNTGEVVVGNIGSETRAKYGIVGSAVNITQRIQSHAKGGEVVVSESVYRSAANHLSITRSFKAQLKGIQEHVMLYAVSITFD